MVDSSDGEYLSVTDLLGVVPVTAESSPVTAESPVSGTLRRSGGRKYTRRSTSVLLHSDLDFEVRRSVRVPETGDSAEK